MNFEKFSNYNYGDNMTETSEVLFGVAYDYAGIGTQTIQCERIIGTKAPTVILNVIPLYPYVSASCDTEIRLLYENDCLYYMTDKYRFLVFDDKGFPYPLFVEQIISKYGHNLYESILVEIQKWFGYYKLKLSSTENNSLSATIRSLSKDNYNLQQANSGLQQTNDSLQQELNETKGVVKYLESKIKEDTILIDCMEEIDH